ncbi:hypothetical protein GGF37_000612 [Kickxella alabastrina]|nr:hypothetical protein GGF37_000612 [Kickxella alabastrina]
MSETNSPNSKPGGANKHYSSMLLRTAGLAWRYKKTSLLVAGIAYLAVKNKVNAAKKDISENIIDGTVLTWRLNGGSIVETTAPTHFGSASMIGKLIKRLSGGPKEMTMLEALLALEMAAEDPRVKSLVVRVTPEVTGAGAKGNEPLSIGLGIAQIQELRQALATFRAKKEAQKQQAAGMVDKDLGRTYFYIDSFDDQATYYLASAFSDIIVQPTGYVPLIGLSSTQFYFKRLGDKIGVNVHVEARKEYKSVVAPYSEESMPEKHRENLMSLLTSLNDTLVADIALARGPAILKQTGQEGSEDGAPLTAADVVRRAMEVGPLPAIDAINAGLVSEQGYPFGIASIIGPRKPMLVSTYSSKRRDEILSKEMHDDPASSGGKQGSLMGSFKQALGRPDIKKVAQSLELLIPSRPVTVGVVYLMGTIERLGPQGSHSVAASLLQAAKDPQVSAIVLRIDSGGGDVIASDTIAAAVDYVQTHFAKPVVASYGNVSASGAYYSSTSCKRIFASPGTITGSIGVAAMRPVFTSKLMEFIGTNVEELYTVDNKCNSVFHAPEGAVLERYQRNVDHIYSDFTARVAKGRGFTGEQAESVARGQVFTGVQALGNGLVDEMGGFTRAIEAAAQLGHEARVDIAKKLVEFYVDRSNNTEIRKAVAYEQFASVDEAVEKITLASKGKKATATADSKPVVAIELKVAKGNDQEAALGAVKHEAPPVFKADILKNVKVKEFPESVSATKSLISRLVFGSSDDKDNGTSGSSTSAALDDYVGGPQMMFSNIVSSAVSAAIRNEIKQILSQDPSSIASSLAQTAQEHSRSQVRAEADQVKFK